MTRTLGHALHKIAQTNNWDFELWSAYDSPETLMPEYLPAKNFKGFGVNKLDFSLKAISSSAKFNVVILSHINLAVIGLFIKLINPKCKVWLIAHGIEVWRPFSFIKRRFLKRCDKIICVSNYTQQQMVKWHNVDKNLCQVLNNAIDPFMELPQNFTKPQKLIDRYQLNHSYPIIFTLTRMASTEKYKGYEQVINAVSRLKNKFPDIKYVLSGQYDQLEQIRITKLLDDHQITEQVILTGFIKEAELADHFLMADLFVLPSKKEGFGIVFIEALALGLPVICGNADGSIDAIRNGELGKAVNADDADDLFNCIAEYLDTPLTASKRKELQERCLMYFNENDYINKLQLMLAE